MTEEDSALDPRIDARISLLREFRELARCWFSGEYDSEGKSELRQKINYLLVPVRRAVLEAGTMKLLTIGPPPAIGGLVAQDMDPFQNFFESFWGVSLIPKVLDIVDQSIGVYEFAANGSDLVSLESKEALDIHTAIYRSLRPSFKDTAPIKETQVQDAVENILNALGVDFLREKEVVVTGNRASKPDFTVEKLALAIEIKLAKDGHGASKIQEEMNSDITAYKSRWQHLMFIVYDLGVIGDPHRMTRENQRLFGVSVLIVKH